MPDVSTTTSGGLRGIQHYLLPKSVTDFIFGYDVFISYSRRDGGRYATRLQEDLTKLDYRCFFDASELPAGEQLGIALRHALRRSTVLVLLGSPGALNSPYVLQEVNGFKEFRPQGKILPISVGRTLDETDPGGSLRQALGDRVWLTEDAEALTQAPTDRVRSELLQIFQFTRRNTWRLRVTTAASIVLGAMAVISLILLVVAQRAKLAAERQARISEIQRLAAESGRVRDDFPQRSLLLAVEAETLARGDSATAQTPWAEQALRDELHNTAGIALPAPEAETIWGQLKQVTISPDGRWAVAIRDNEMAPLWDLAAINPSASVKTLRSEPGYFAPPITAATFTHDSRSLIVGQGSAVLLHDLANLDTEPRSLVTIPMNPTVNELAITADSHWLAACVGEFKDCESLYLIDMRSREPTVTPLISGKFTGDKIKGLIVSPDSHWLICAGEDKLIHFWNLTTGAPASQPHTIRGFGEKIEEIALSSNGEWLVTGGVHKVSVWPVGDQGVKANPRVLDCHDCPLLSKVAISPEGQWIGGVGATATAVPLWYSFLSNWEGDLGEHYVVRGHSSGLNDLAFSPDNRWLVTAGSDKTARLWDLKSLDVAESGTVLSGHDAGVNSVAFSPDSRWILTGGDDSTAHLWRLDTRGLERATPERISGEPSRAQSVSADGRLLIVKTSEDLITLDLTTSDPSLTTPTLMAADWSAAHVCMSPDGQWLVAADRNAFGSDAVLWKLLPERSEIKPISLRGHKDDISACQISADNHWVATASNDGTARLWDLTGPTPGQTSFVLSGHSDILHALAFDPGSRFIVTGSRDRTARLWNLKAQNPADGSIIVANDGQGVDSSITAVALSDNAQRLVTGDYNGLVRVRNLASGAAPITLRGHRKEIVGAAISSDGQLVVTGSEDSTIRIWNLRPEPPSVPIVLREDEQPRFLSLSKDGRFIVSGNDKAIELWQLKVDELMRLARVIAGRNLSHAEWRELFPGKPYVKTFKELSDPTDE